MKIDTNRLKKGTSEVPTECQVLIDKLKTCNRNDLRIELKKIETWTFGKCELYHWIDVLDIFDQILEEACEWTKTSEWFIAIDNKFSSDDKQLVLLVLNFTASLIEHSFSRHLYNSVEHLITLLKTIDLDVVLAVLNLLYMFSKRSNFISRVIATEKMTLLSRVSFLAESWGGKEQSFGLAECCEDKHFSKSPYHTQYFEIVNENQSHERISLADLSSAGRDPRVVAEYVCSRLDSSVSNRQKIHVYTRIRAASYFLDYKLRLKFVQARLQALSILVYSNFTLINIGSYLYPGFMEELVDVLQMENPKLVEIQAAALRTLTSIIHLDRNPHYPKKPGSRLFTIIDVTGASSYHGFLPGLVRSCILNLINPADVVRASLFPMALATSLFSFLYHLASYEAGGEALVASGMMDSLLKVINWPGTELEHVTFVTRAVRVIDLITNIDMQSFQNYGGLHSFIKRLEMEVNICRIEQPYEIRTKQNINDETQIDDMQVDEDIPVSSMPPPTPSTSTAQTTREENLRELKEKMINLPPLSPVGTSTKTHPSKMCLPQRAALLKSMLNFLKKAIQDAAFSESIRHVMEGRLPGSLRHIISNAEYYGPSLFLLATDVVTVYVFQEPSLLFFLQDIGLTDVVLQSLLKKDVPATREVLGSLPNVFSALCLNTRGLNAFVKYNPFDKLFRVLLSPTYLSAMRRRRSSDPMGDTASNLGNAMDELMRHQPSLRHKATQAVIRLLEELVYFGNDPIFICWRAQNKTDSPSTTNHRTNSNSNRSSPNPNTGNPDPGSSDDDDDDDDEEEASTSSTHHQNQGNQATQPAACSNPAIDSNEKWRIPVPIIDYILNIMKFVDAILSNNSTDDHCIEFINEGGLQPLLSILALPNLPIDSPITASAQSVAAVCKSILNLSHDPRVLRIGLSQLSDVVEQLKPLTGHLEKPGGSVLLRELANCPSIEGAFSNASHTPLLHAMSAVHGYVVMLVHVCRTGQAEIRHLSLQCWGSDTKYGKRLLQNLVQLYTALVWESTLLLALCTDDIIPPGCDFAREDIEKLVPGDFKGVSEITWDKIILNNRRVGVAKIVETLENGSMEFETPPPIQSTLSGGDNGSDDTNSNMKRQIISPTPAQLKYIKALLGASSRLGRALAELFGLLVKLCVGSTFRQRRQTVPQSSPAHSKAIARVLSHILVDGLSFEKLPPSPIPKLKLTFLICSVGFTSPMLFDDKRYAYHLMLEKFVDEGGLKAFFNMFRWALSLGDDDDDECNIESPNLPDGTGEFLDAWLLLLEKLSNPRAILDSPHIITTVPHKNLNRPQAKSEFDSLTYLKNIHSVAFEALQNVWGYKPLKIYGVRMTESVLAILRHIIRGESIIKLRVEEKNKAISDEYVKQLMDMGFPRKQCVTALERARGLVETATEMLLLADSNEKTALEIEREAKEFCARSCVLTETAIDRFTDDAVFKTITLLDELPESVYRVCDLIVSIIQRNGCVWRDFVLDIYVEEVLNATEKLLVLMKNINNYEEICNGEAAKRAAVRIHLFTLLFEGHCTDEMRVPCALALYRAKIISKLLTLLVEIEKMMTIYTASLDGNKPFKQTATDTSANNDSTQQPNITPKWLAPLFLLLDLYEKVATMSNNRVLMHRVTTKSWKWYDLATGRWNNYSETSNRAIDNAYWLGQPLVRVTCGRQRYSINFNCMTQVNEETGTHRPVIMSLQCCELPNVNASIDNSIPSQNTRSQTNRSMGRASARPSTQENSSNCNIKKMNETEKIRFMNGIKHEQSNDKSYEITTKIPGLERCNGKEIVIASVRLMKLPIDRDTLHALMRICLRLTRDNEHAMLFAREGGVKILLSLGQESSYLGFSTLATLLIRHTLEEPKTLALAMEQVLASRTLPSLPPGYKELIYLTRQMSAAVARNPSAWIKVASSVLRIDVDIMDVRVIVKSIVTNNAKSSRREPGNLTDEVVQDLLAALLDSDISFSTININSESTHAFDRFNISMDTDSPTPSKPENQDENMADASGSSETAKKTLLLPKLEVLKILAAAVRSYSSVALQIVEFNYTSENFPSVPEKISALSFVLDYLLPIPDTDKDRDCSSGAKVLIASLSSCSDSRVLNIVASEVKSALNRALSMPESRVKHTRIQLICEVIQTMIESFPPENTPNTIGVKLNQYQPLRATLFYIMYRKNILTDLARASQSIDLTSPDALNTINAILEPLETLIRLSNQAATTSKIPRGIVAAQSTSSATTRDQSNFNQFSRPIPGNSQQVAGSARMTRTAQGQSPFQVSLERILDHFLDSATGNIDINIDIQQQQSESGNASSRGAATDAGSSSQNENEHQSSNTTLLETSSESGGETDSNQTDNEEREMEEVEENEDEDDNDDNDDDDEDEEERSEMDVEEATRQFFDLYNQHTLHAPSSSGVQQNHQSTSSNHVFSRRLSPNLLERVSDDILMIQFTTDQNNENSDGSNNIIHERNQGNNSSNANASNNVTGSPQRFLFPPLDEAIGSGAVGGSGSHNETGSGIANSGLHPHHHHQSNQHHNQTQNTVTHPLLIGRAPITSAAPSTNQDQNSSSSRNQQRALTRQRRYQYFNFNPRNANPTPVILQRLLGPVNQGNSNQTQSTAFRDATRVVLMDNSGFGLFSSRNDEETIDVVDHSGYLFGRSLAATLNQTPTALHWWSEEAKILGSESQCDLCLYVSSQVIPSIQAIHMKESLKMKDKKAKKRTAVEEKPTKTTTEPQIATTSTSTTTSETSDNGNSLPMVILPASSVRTIANNTSNHDDSQVANSSSLVQPPRNRGTYILRQLNIDNESQSTNDNNGGDNSSSNIINVDQDPAVVVPLSAAVDANNAMTVANNQQTESNHNIPIFDDDSVSYGMPVLFLNQERSSRILHDYCGSETTQQGNVVEQNFISPAPVPPTDNNRIRSEELETNRDISIYDEDAQHYVRPTRVPNEDNTSTLSSGDYTSLSSQSPLGSDDIMEIAASIPLPEDDDYDVLEFPALQESDEEDAQQQMTQQERNREDEVGENDDEDVDDEEEENGEEEEEEEEDETVGAATNTANPTSASFSLGNRSSNQQQQTVPQTAQTGVQQGDSVGSSGDSTLNVHQTACGRRILLPSMEELRPGPSPLFAQSVRNLTLPSLQELEQFINEQSSTTATPNVDDSLRTILGDIEVPDGVDPSFLAALPNDMRAEVLSDHVRMQRNRQRSNQTTVATSNVQTETPVVEVNPEFLAALPANIQEEVLAQQRIEIQRQAAVASNPHDPVDAAAFFQNLSPTLRQTILTDMEESQISALPPELAAEAQTLRRDWESRNRQIMQERLLSQIGTSSSNYPSSANFASVLRYRRHNLTRPRWTNWNNTGTTTTSTSAGDGTGRSLHIPQSVIERYTPLLDHESIASILVLIFIIDSRIYNFRLLRIIRHLCVHVPTRIWIIKSLISILDKCNLNDTDFYKSLNKGKIPEYRPTWLGIKVDPSISSTADVFTLHGEYTIERLLERKLPITIHPQSVTPICCEVLDHLISIAKTYPMDFLPITRKKPVNPSQQSSSSSSSTAGQTSNTKPQDFFDILLQIDANAFDRQENGGTPFGPFSTTPRSPKQFDDPVEFKSFDETPFGKLVPMLTSSRNTYITDKLLRLLSLISIGFTYNSYEDNIKKVNTNNRNRLDKLDMKLLPEGFDKFRVIVNTLTSCSGSEEGLEDATNLILNSSKCSQKTRSFLYELLIESVKELASKVEERIVDLMIDVTLLNQDRSDNNPSTSKNTTQNYSNYRNQHGYSIKGELRDRFTQDIVVVNTSNVQFKSKTGCDLHLVSMGPLTSKSSCQATFLRILKVIIQIREGAAIDASAKLKKNKNQSKEAETNEDIESSWIDLDSDDDDGENEYSKYSTTLPLSEVLKLNSLWTTLSECLVQLEQTADHHAVLVLQPAVEAFFLVHASSQRKSNMATNQENSISNTQNSSATSSSSISDDIPPLSPLTNQEQMTTDQKKFLKFAEKHRTVLNQILRQSTSHLADGPFSCLVDHAKILDFDVKRRYFRTELEKLDEGVRREELAVHVHRVTVFEDSFKELYRRSPEEWKNRFYIVFEDEEGQDAGGLLREWYMIISREIFNPMYALFTVSPGDRVTYMINPLSHANPNHLCYYKFVGRVIAKAIYDNKLLECYFTRAFYKHILGVQVKCTDMESEDYDFYKGLAFLMENHVSALGYDLTFSLEVQEFGVTSVRDIIPNGRNMQVTEENKMEYIHMVCQLKMSGSIKQQLNAFLEGFYDIIPKRLISIFNEQELELLISGLPNIDIEDLRVNTEYHKYQLNSIQIQWFWRALRSFNQAERAKFLQFVTGTSKVPLQGFAALEGMNGIQKFQIHLDDRSTERLPSAHTCFNQLDLPVYKTYDKLRYSLLKAIHECTEGFGFA